MPQFSNSCNVKHCDRKLSQEELVRAIRFNIAAEYEAIQLYQQVIESTDNELVKIVLADIADEEKEHAGELLKVLNPSITQRGQKKSKICKKRTKNRTKAKFKEINNVTGRKNKRKFGNVQLFEMPFLYDIL